MIRILSYVVVVAVMVAAAVWLADRPGTVVVDWLGWRIETVVPVLLAALLLVAAVLTGLFRLIIGLARWPGQWNERRRDQRRHKGYQALTDGLVAAAAGEAGRAAKLAGRAERLLDDPALTGFLSAQAAQLSGDAGRAHEHFTAMLDRPETAALGLRGLLRHALEQGDDAQAIDLATRARIASPDDRWLAETLFGLLIKRGQLREAQDLLNDAIRRKALPKDEAGHARALVLNERAARAVAEGDQRAALDFARQAVKADPGLTAAALRLAGLFTRTGKTRQAAGVIERAWARRPDPALARAYADLEPAQDALARVRRLEKLVASRADDPQSLLVLGEASLDAKLWGQARKDLLAAAERQPTSGVFRLLARLEQAEYNDQAAAGRWLEKAATAPADPVWLCGRCGAESGGGWAALCPTCGALDSMTWRSPGAKPAAMAG